MNGDDFPVVGPPTSPYKFILVCDQTGEKVCDLCAEFVPDDGPQYTEADLPDVWSSDHAHSEALEVLGYSVKVVKK
jgi:hypothetical protein